LLRYFKLIDRKGEVKSSSVLAYDQYFFPISKLMDRVLFGKIGKNIEVVAVKK